jgi:hypothetical protein
VIAATDTHAITELLVAVFSVPAVPTLRNEDKLPVVHELIYLTACIDLVSKRKDCI